MRAHQNQHGKLLSIVGLLAVSGTQAALTGCQMREQGLAGASATSGAPLAPARPDAGVPRGPDGSSSTTPPVKADAAASDVGVVLPGNDAATTPADASPASDLAVAPSPDLAPEAPASSFSCANLPNGPFNGRQVEDLPRSDEITFDNEGRLLAFSQNDVVRIVRGVPNQFVARNVITARGGGALEVLPDGDIVVADYSRDRLIRIDAMTGVERNPLSVRSPMKIVRGPADTVYVTSNDGAIYRIDPKKVGLPGDNRGPGNSESQLVAAQTDLSLGGLTFSADFKRLYVGAVDRDQIYSFPVNADGSLGGQTVFVSGVPSAQALTTDVCGNLYAVGNSDGRLRRITADGRVTVIANLQAQDVWALSFGSGRHGFSAEALYALDRNGGTLYEVRVGVGERPIVP